MPLKTGEGSLIMDHAVIETTDPQTGQAHEIRIGQNCIVHPLAQLLALRGSIEVGDRVIIEERVRIENL